MCKKYGINEYKHILHLYETCFGKRLNQASLREGLICNMGNSDKYFNKLYKYEKKWKKELKDLKKQSKILYIIAKLPALLGRPRISILSAPR